MPSTAADTAADTASSLSGSTSATPKGMRLHIGLFGRRNVGKSSLLNALVRQDISIVSNVAGTTADPVEKAMELLPLGPVLFIDTAGVDDEGALGALRIEKTRLTFDRTDLALLVAEEGVWSAFEDGLLAEFERRKTPVIVVFNKGDLGVPDQRRREELTARGFGVASTCARTGQGLDDVRTLLIERAPESLFADRPILSDLVGPGELAILVTPIDKEAPRGRLILPQVQSIRDLLDAQALALVTTEKTLPSALSHLKALPKLVVTDSQAFREVDAMLPEGVPLTSFSILFARLKGELAIQAEGTLALDALKPGDRVLIAEACAHHPIGEDIGRVKIPRWLNQKVGGALNFETVQGRDFPDDLTPYAMVIHCGACTFNRRGMLSRIERCQRQGVPISNYGLAIAAALGILDKALGPFPDVHRRYLEKRAASKG
ncbi:MAG: [FeFe] hydrogenase H-cluster maturation GTPase HydF [Myxococcales bacterium]|nr:[FeFe] hydrogenase H-cluster maturation GTPase HydF [Myxococcales bacterium]